MLPLLVFGTRHHDVVVACIVGVFLFFPSIPDDVNTAKLAMADDTWPRKDMFLTAASSSASFHCIVHWYMYG